MTSLPAMNPSMGWKPKTCTIRPLINDDPVTTLSRIEDVLRYFIIGFDGFGHDRHCQLTTQLRFRNSR